MDSALILDSIPQNLRSCLCWSAENSAVTRCPSSATWPERTSAGQSPLSCNIAWRCRGRSNSCVRWYSRSPGSYFESDLWCRFPSDNPADLHGSPWHDWLSLCSWQSQCRRGPLCRQRSFLPLKLPSKKKGGGAGVEDHYARPVAIQLLGNFITKTGYR